MILSFELARDAISFRPSITGHNEMTDLLEGLILHDLYVRSSSVPHPDCARVETVVLTLQGEGARAALREAVGTGEFFHLVLPDGSRLVHAVAKSERHPVAFGREIAAELAGAPQRADWRECKARAFFFLDAIARAWLCPEEEVTPRAVSWRFVSSCKL